MWKLLLTLSLGIATGAAGMQVYIRLTTQVAVTTAVGNTCPRGLRDAGQTINLDGDPQGHIPSLSK